MYADNLTESMKVAIEETNRRRAVQERYNAEHGIEPQTIIKGIHDINDRLRAVGENRVGYSAERRDRDLADADKAEVERLVARMEAEMKAAAKELEFDRAAAIRDEIQQIRPVLMRTSPWSSRGPRRRRARGAAGEGARRAPSGAFDGGASAFDARGQGRRGRCPRGGSAGVAYLFPGIRDSTTTSGGGWLAGRAGAPTGSPTSTSAGGSASALAPAWVLEARTAPDLA
jgi:hypothetical protein